MGCSRQTIAGVANGEYGRKTAMGYKWRYATKLQMPYGEGEAK